VSEDEENARERRRQQPARTPYEVGYARPPAATRFKPGVSGNPKGRPKGAKNRLPALHEERLKSIIHNEAYRPVRVRLGKKTVTRPVVEAIVRSIADDALNGNRQAQKHLLQLVAAIEAENKRPYDDYARELLDYKYDWEEEIERRRAAGLPEPELVPHPDDIRIDPRTDLVVVKGPWTKEQKSALEKLRTRIAEFEEELATLQQDLAMSDESDREMIQKEIARTERILARLRELVPDWAPGRAEPAPKGSRRRPQGYD
jgi:Family of unknown function (DUF5681)